MSQPAVDYENLRTMEEYRELIEQEIATLRRIGFPEETIGVWLSGARWATRVFRGMQA